ncbi:phosphonate transport system substrate-binding protein [Paucidesulfovibrio gracilis DSM 16080]|jgi:phosphonate transport system substrate-binding protein|uniref:Phosphonate transport system substrate-binding protein n=1 Tax=Paucidesulfovibrio gracilis DSM 16080 TaxID=1121449 RepID=A0A1T4WWS5_9BACT|nr:phosphate/phosphite/phosphonate ABC transporter substrate-binding protein [Paucidesulfovibrio gracilis]SKA81822.1 phosphonate transport system substrate-binding protein [Paucidesulfovibrio gracilis DSM 16080]
MGQRARVACFAVFLIVVFGCLSGCGDDEPFVRVDLSRREELAARPPREAVTYAYLPQYSHAVSYERHRQLLEYLRRETGLPLRQIFPDTFDEHIEMVKRGEIDISFSNPFVYIQLARDGARAFARIVEPDGRPFFRGQIICRSDNRSIHTLQDCRGKRWIAVDPNSAGGYLFPLGLFLERGLRVDDFSQIAFAPGPGGKQEKVVLSVHSGTYDLGSIRKGTLDILADKVDLSKIRVLAETRDYPGWVYAARRGLDPEVVRKVREAMFALDPARPDDERILTIAGMRGIVPAADHDYDEVRALVRRLDDNGSSPGEVR